MSEIASDDEALPEISVAAYDKLDRWRDKLDQTPKIDKRGVFECAAADLFLEAEFEHDLGAWRAMRDAIYVLGRDHAWLDDDSIQFVMVGAQDRAERPANRQTVHGSDAAPAIKNLPVAFPLQAFENISLDIERRNYLVKGLIASTGLAVIWGPPKCGKSFWAADLGLHIALGWEYRGHKVQQASVVYVALEGRHGFPARFKAFRRHHGVDSAPFYLLTESLDLVKKSEQLIASIKAQLRETLPGVVFLDTLNRSLVGSESKDEDMARYLAAAERVAQELSCAVVIVHHCGIDGTRPRGHTSLSAAVESQLKVERASTGEVIVTVELAKDFAEGTQIFSRLERVELGTDADGDAIASLVVLPADKAAQAKPQRKIKGAKKVAFDLLRKAIDEAGEAAPASSHIPGNTRTILVETWRTYTYQGTITESDNPEARQKAFARAAKDLQEAGLIGKWGNWVWIIAPTSPDKPDNNRK